MTIDERKVELRRRMRLLRSAIPPDERGRRCARATQRLLSTREASAALVAFVFRSFGSEISTAGVIEGLVARGVRVALPVLVNGTLEAASYRPGDPLVPSGYGAEEPLDRSPLDAAAIDLVVAPGLAFDLQGYRLGYGGGYYDAFLPRLRTDAARVGFGFDLQVVDAVPHGPRDERLHAVVTDERVVSVAPS